jgi:anti-sigma B factor antagonist
MLPDLELRVYAPIPEVVIVRVSGTVNTRTAAVVAQRVGHQLTRAPHVVVDLGEVTAMDTRGLTVFRTLHRQATATGTEIHLVRAEHDAVSPALRTTGLDQLFTVDSTADAVIAGLPRQATPHDGPARSGANQPDLEVAQAKGEPPATFAGHDPGSSQLADPIS